MGILAWGVLPPLLLLAYIYWLDKAEREPLGLIVKALLFGCLSVIPAALIEEILSAVLDIFLPLGLLYDVIFYFGVVAITEEGCKRMAMKWAVWKNAEFNYLFDAILYMVAAGLGFALVENVEYMLIYGEGIALARLIPVHTICAVFMGLSLAAAKNFECAGDKAGAKREHRMSLIVPIAIHGVYDFGVSSGNDLLAVAVLLMVCVLTVVAFLKVKDTAKRDRPFFGVLTFNYSPVGGQTQQPGQVQPAQMQRPVQVQQPAQMQVGQPQFIQPQPVQAQPVQAPSGQMAPGQAYPSYPYLGQAHPSQVVPGQVGAAPLDPRMQPPVPPADFKG